MLMPGRGIGARGKRVGNELEPAEWAALRGPERALLLDETRAYSTSE